jgi:hypothetical protein
MTWQERAARFAAGAERARAKGNTKAFVDLIVASRACACIEEQIKRAEKWLEKEE